VEDVLPTLLDLAQIPKEKQPVHLPFSGKSFRASLEDSKFADERDIFRVATGGPGLPRGIIPDARTLDYGSLHVILRSGAYKFHHLPGGQTRLYSMEKDPGEKNDLSKKMPERTASMAARCRAQWDETAERNRIFQMRQLIINNADRPQKSWVIPVLQPRRVAGKIRARDFGGGVKGFRLPGDRVDYLVDVQKPLTVSFVVEGKGFERCAPLNLLVDGQPVECSRRAEDRIEFGSAELPAGNMPLSLVVPADAKAGSADGEVLRLTLHIEL
jgi:hypothetical protein